MQHYYFSRHAKINWLTLDRFSNYSSEDLLNGAFSIHWESEGDHILEFRDQLEELSDEILEQRFSERIEFRVKDRKQHREEVDAGLFFNAPAAFADYGRWARNLTWTIEQCIALSMGRSPDVLSLDALRSAGSEALHSDFGREYIGRLEIAWNWISIGQLAETATPTEYLVWLNQLHLDFPPGLIQALEAFGNEIIDWKAQSESLTSQVEQLREEMSTLFQENQNWAVAYENLQTTSGGLIEELKERLGQAELALKVSGLDEVSNEEGDSPDPRSLKSLHKIVYAMAVKKYHFDATQDEWPAVTKILNDLELAGLQMSRKALRGHLKISAETAVKELGK
ncbi:MAG TPA: hypothetical protein DCG65_08455 [Hyphomonas atlantica]|uniref:Uncharacterized protein n=1 Tax=Hyphomonas atlantica TaxID=1280948 RepID=A0A3B9L0X3_9PROT|nr:hypothetical protein [Hyphomonas atlantica]